MVHQIFGRIPVKTMTGILSIFRDSAPLAADLSAHIFYIGGNSLRTFASFGVQYCLAAKNVIFTASIFYLKL